jgi:hypothetical protein
MNLLNSWLQTSQMNTKEQDRLMQAIEKMNAQSAWELEQNARTILTKLGFLISARRLLSFQEVNKESRTSKQHCCSKLICLYSTNRQTILIT